MSIFVDIPKKVSEWIGVPGLLAAFTLSLAVWLYYDLVVEMTLNGTMTTGLGICSLLIVACVKLTVGLIRKSSSEKENESNE